MPFRTEKQRRFLWANHPDLARKWTNKYGPRPVKKGKHMDLKEVGKYGPGIKKAGEHYSKSFRDGPGRAKSWTPSAARPASRRPSRARSPRPQG